MRIWQKKRGAGRLRLCWLYLNTVTTGACRLDRGPPGNGCLLCSYTCCQPQTAPAYTYLHGYVLYIQGLCSLLYNLHLMLHRLQHHLRIVKDFYAKRGSTLRVSTLHATKSVDGQNPHFAYLYYTQIYIQVYMYEVYKHNSPTTCGDMRKLWLNKRVVDIRQ